MNALSITGVTAGYHERPVTTKIDLRVSRSKVVALVGPNGAGKSTLIRALTGVIPTTGGQVQLDGVNLLGLSPLQRARRVAVVPQQALLPEAFTVSEVVLLGRTPFLPLWAKESANDHRISRAAMEMTSVHGLADRFVGELSGGEQQRVVIARALAQEPDVLLLDEPTAHLDLKHQNSILTLVRSLAVDCRLSVLLTMHDLNQAAACAHEVALLVDGKIQAIGPPGEVFTSERLSQAYDAPVDVIPHPHNGAPLVTTNGRPPPT